MLAAGPTFDQLPELEGRLAAARKDGGADAAAKLAARAQEALIKAAAAEMEKDEIETGVGALQGGAGAGRAREGTRGAGRGVARARDDRADGAQGPALAVRWAREGVALDNNDGDATRCSPTCSTPRTSTRIRSTSTGWRWPGGPTTTR